MNAVVVGGGPAGLMAAEVLAEGGAAVVVADHMRAFGRKLLMAGRGGLNITHSEPFARVLARYGAAAPFLEPALRAFPPERLVAWCEALGQPTFVGSSGRVFPVAMKASPLLRAWLARLAAQGVRFAAGHRWIGPPARCSPPLPDPAGAVVLACGGASWPRLGSDASWVAALPGVPVAPLRPANCGFAVAWSQPFAARFAGAPLKRVALLHADAVARGEAVVTAHGLEGGAVYALSAALRDAIGRDGATLLHIDLRPDLDAAVLARRLAQPRRGQSLSTFLRKQAGLPPVAVGLVQEALHAGAADATDLAGLVRRVPVRLVGVGPLARAISTAGGIAWSALDAHFMLRRHPGVFAAGEMLDFEAPTGGYLLQAAFSTGRAAGLGALRWLRPA